MAHILIVEDEPLVGMELCDLLQEEGHTAFFTPNGEAALAALERHCPDLVIADFKMPMMNGGVMTQNIRTDRRWRRTPVLMISSYNLAEADLASFGANGFVQKPWSRTYLLLTINQLLKARQ
jgi:CheY-like chemotaxis protein